ncbi:MAG TPA: isoprenylcysteine carboxylmethyltransferase family protein [Gaiellaceae bacterium]|nr:isoprenylcysteine carboxylmethyltransferase family protein [Gaiellaceae bacterium]
MSRATPGPDGRGGGWVVAQAVLTAAVALSALVGLGESTASYVAGGVLIAAGVALLVESARRLGRSLTPFPAPVPGATLRTEGVYALVRHPMYLGGILVAAGWSALFESVVGGILTVALAAFFALKSRHEEARLEAAYPAYADYRRRTRWRLLPYLY